MIDRIDRPGSEFHSTAERFGELLAEKLKSDRDFYFFSPDETNSNRLGAVYEASERAWNLRKEKWDLPESADGHIIELLSENTLFATMLGHIHSGGPAVMASYEAFYNIITSQVVQELKFLAQSDAVSFRTPVPAINLLSTSTCWRQDHNGYSHQSPLLISTLLSTPGSHANCLFPVDDVSADAAWDYMQNSKNVVNLTTFNKSLEPRWIDSHHATFQYNNGGVSVYQFASDDKPDVIFTAAGDLATKEALYAIKILKSDLPELKIRFVGIAALSYHHIGTTDNPLSQSTFDQYFDKKLPIIANFQGYPDALENILGQYADKSRLSVHGYEEHGSTTTPFEMLSLNHASRYDLALDVAKRLKKEQLVKSYSRIIKVNHAYAEKFSKDLEPITEFGW